jgi:hypothetical protein
MVTVLLRFHMAVVVVVVVVVWGCLECLFVATKARIRLKKIHFCFSDSDRKKEP